MSESLSFRRIMRSIRKKSEFASVYSSGPSCVRFGLFKAYCSRRSSCPFARLGMVVPKKATKTAVKRNLVKRFIREHFRTNANHLPETDIVVSLVGNVSALPKIDIRNQISSLFLLLKERQL